MARSNTDPEMFKRFTAALKASMPPGYTPFLLKLKRGGKHPAVPKGENKFSWKAKSLTINEAVEAMENGYNIGIAATDTDQLVIIDIDDPVVFIDHEFSETLMAVSGGRIGNHAFYKSTDPRTKINVALENEGEIRSSYEYVVAPGSWARLTGKADKYGKIIKTIEERMEEIPQDDRENAGTYELINDQAIKEITYEGLPKRFTDAFEKTILEDAKLEDEIHARKAEEGDRSGNQDKSKSGLYAVKLSDVEHFPTRQSRFSSQLHDSSTGANSSISSNGELHSCWRDLVTHNALQYAAVKAGMYTCGEAGKAHSGSGAGRSRVDLRDGKTVYTIWEYLKETGVLPKDDPMPSIALKWYALDKGYCKESDIREGWRVPGHVYIKVLKDVGLFEERQETADPPPKAVEPITSEIIQAKLQLIHVDEDAIKKLKIAIKFIEDELVGLEKASKNTIITSYVKEHFGFTSAQIRDIISTITKKDKAKLSKPDISAKVQNMSKYFDEKNVFIPKVLGDEILKEFDILTYQDTKELAVYKNGVFGVEGGEDALRVSALKKLGDDFKRERLNEVIEYIKLNTLVKRIDINPEAGLINLQNGMYNIVENKLIPHDIKYKSTIQLNVQYNEEAQCPEIDKFLHEVANIKDVPVLVQYTGYSCTQEIKHQKALMIEGPRANGKSTYIELVCSIVGQEHVSEQSIQALNSDRFARAQLNGKLINMFPDLPKKKLYDNSVFKMLTTDKWIDGEEKYIRKFRFKNTIHQIYSANKIPAVDDPDEMAYFRRWIIASFPNTFEGKKADKNLLEKLTTETEIAGFFNICMVGLRALMEHDDFCNQPTVEEIRNIYLIKSDPIQAFLNECIEYSNYDIVKQDLFEIYERWCKKKKITNTIKDNIFGAKLKKMGYEDHRQTGGERLNVWKNIGISFTGMVYGGGANKSVRGGEIALTDLNTTTDTDYTTIRQGSRGKGSIVDKYKKIYSHAYACVENNNVYTKEFVPNSPDALTDAKKQDEETPSNPSGENQNPDGLIPNPDGLHKDQRTRIKEVRDIIFELQQGNGNRAHRDAIKSAAEDMGISDTDTILKHMAIQGQILQHKADVFQVI